MKDYIKYSVILIIISVLGLWGLGSLSQIYTQGVDQNQLEASKVDSSLLVPSITGKAMGIDQIYAINKTTDLPNLVIYGNSTTILGVISENWSMSQRYEIINASSGSASIEGMMTMKGYLETQNISQDKVLIDISPTTFQKRTKNQEVIVSSLEYGDNYKVDDTYKVEPSLYSPMSRFISLNARYIEKAIEYMNVKVVQGNYNSLFETTTYSFKNYEKTLSLDEERLETLIEFIESFDQPEIELLYQNPEFIESEAGTLYNTYIDENLIPYLNEHNITYYDYRYDIDSEYFTDNNHLNYQGREIYTQLVEEKYGN